MCNACFRSMWCTLIYELRRLLNALVTGRCLTNYKSKEQVKFIQRHAAWPTNTQRVQLGCVAASRNVHQLSIICMRYTIYARRGTEQQYQAAAAGGRQHASQHRYYITRWCLGFSSAIQFLVSLVLFLLLFHALFASFIGRNFRLSVWNSCCCCCNTILCRYTNGEYTIQQLNTRHVSPSGMHYTLRTYTHSHTVWIPQFYANELPQQKRICVKIRSKNQLKCTPKWIAFNRRFIWHTLLRIPLLLESERRLDLSLNAIDHGS